MNEMDDHLKLVHDLRPAMLDQLTDDGYARRRDHDMARAIAEGHAHPSPARRTGLPLGRGRQRWSHRRVRSLDRATAAGTAAAVLLVVAAQFGLWQHGTSGGSAATAVTNPQPGTMRHGSAPQGASLRMRLVDSLSSPFRTSGTGPQSSAFQCVTVAVCYAWAVGRGIGSAARTADGGATWRPIAAPPGQLGVFQIGEPPSCPTVEVCIAGAGPLRLAATADGGAHWSIEPVPSPAGSSGATIDALSCPTAQRCVVHLSGDGPGAFMVTINGGRTWTESSALPAGAPAGLALLRCDPDGKCVGLAPGGGTATAEELAAMQSADGGRTWTASSPVPLPTSPLGHWSCGDALHCMVVGFSSNTTMTTTSDGGVTWRTTVAPASWPSTPADVSCAGPDCFISLADFNHSLNQGAGGFDHPAIEAVYNGATTWTTLSLPHVGGSPLAIVFPLSCPSPAGCIGAAATARQDAGDSPGRVIISSFAPAGPQAAGG